MKTILLTALSMPLCLFICHSQIEVDKPIELTGGTGERMIFNLEAPVSSTDAVNKEYVDAAVSGSGGGVTPTQISDESATAMTFGAALRYCNALSEGGNTDWWLPSQTELLYILSKGATTVSNNASANWIWLGGDPVSYSSSYWWGVFRLSNGGRSLVDWGGSSTAYVRCVR